MIRINQLLVAHSMFLMIKTTRLSILVGSLCSHTLIFQRRFFPGLSWSQADMGGLLQLFLPHGIHSLKLGTCSGLCPAGLVQWKPHIQMWGRRPGLTILNSICFRTHRGGCSVLTMGSGQWACIPVPTQKHREGSHSFQPSPGAVSPPFLWGPGGPLCFHTADLLHRAPWWSWVPMATQLCSLFFIVLPSPLLELSFLFLHLSVGACFRNIVSSVSQCWE